jgi:hypothetical protein
MITSPLLGVADEAISAELSCAINTTGKNKMYISNNKFNLICSSYKLHVKMYGKHQRPIYKI